MVKPEYNKLSEEESYIIEHKGTEAPFSGKYNDFFRTGIYKCKRCEAPLYKSQDKFKSKCGWPSFDDEVIGAVTRKLDADGMRTEIICSNCKAHLGHIFKNEGFTRKNIRHCVNSLSLIFEVKTKKEEKAYFAGGCFWGVEYLFEKKQGVISAVSGYMGGEKDNPTYKEICTGNTGHLEAVEVTYNPLLVNYENLVRYFFEIHDPTQANGQGPDIGEQYLSAVFYNNIEEKRKLEQIISILKNKGYAVVTKLLKKQQFWRAEEYHQNYYNKNKKKPYCHIYQKKF